MNWRNFKLWRIVPILVMAVLFGSGSRSGAPVKVRYQITEESKLFLKGTTNVNTFSCDCTDRFPPKYLDAESQGGQTRYKNAGIRITVDNFNCRNRKIESDLQKAMKSGTYPHISIDLSETWQDERCLNGKCKDWFEVTAKARITITNVTKERTIYAKAKVLGNNRFLLRGEESLNMSEFGIEPPHAMFGLIKVNDKITFHFDLTVEAGEHL